MEAGLTQDPRVTNKTVLPPVQTDVTKSTVVNQDKRNGCLPPPQADGPSKYSQR